MHIKDMNADTQKLFQDYVEFAKLDEQLRLFNQYGIADANIDANAKALTMMIGVEQARILKLLQHASL